MAPADPTNLYADSPERMLLLSILLVVMVALFVLYNNVSGKKSSARPASPSAQLPSVAKPDQTPLETPLNWVGPEQQPRPS